MSERLQAIGGFDLRARRFQDWDTWIRLCYKYGDFKNLSKPLYIMHHDHAIGSSRVTSSYPANLALLDLKNRNIDKYSSSELYVINYLIKYHAGTSNILEAVKASILAKNIKFLIKDIFKKLGFL